MATVMFIPESTQNRFAMRAVINYCQQEYKTFDSKFKRILSKRRKKPVSAQLRLRQAERPAVRSVA